VGLKTTVRSRIRNRRRWTEERKVDHAFLGGLFLLACGCGWIYPPLLLIVGGGLMAAVAWSLGRTAPPAAAAGAAAEVAEA